MHIFREFAIEPVVIKHRLIHLLPHTAAQPFLITPDLCMILVQGLYRMDSEYPLIYPEWHNVFSRYIPCLRPANIREHDLYVAEAHHFIQQMRMEGHPLRDAGESSGRKRSADDSMVIRPVVDSGRNDSSRRGEEDSSNVKPRRNYILGGS